MKKLILSLMLLSSLYAPVSAMFPDTSSFYASAPTTCRTYITQAAHACKKWATSLVQQAKALPVAKATLAKVGLVAAATAGAAYGIHKLFLPTNNSLIQKATQELNTARLYLPLLATLKTHTKECLKNPKDPLEVDEQFLEELAKPYEYNILTAVEQNMKNLEYYSKLLATRISFKNTLATLHIKTSQDLYNKMITIHNTIDLCLIDLQCIQVVLSGHSEYFDLYAHMSYVNRTYGNGSTALQVPQKDVNYPRINFAAQLDNDLNNLKKLSHKASSCYPILAQNAIDLHARLTQQRNDFIKSDAYKLEQRLYNCDMINQHLMMAAQAYDGYSHSQSPQHMQDPETALCVPGL